MGDAEQINSGLDDFCVDPTGLAPLRYVGEPSVLPDFSLGLCEGGKLFQLLRFHVDI